MSEPSISRWNRSSWVRVLQQQDNSNSSDSIQDSESSFIEWQDLEISNFSMDGIEADEPSESQNYSSSQNNQSERTLFDDDNSYVVELSASLYPDDFYSSGSSSSEESIYDDYDENEEESDDEDLFNCETLSNLFQDCLREVHNLESLDVDLYQNARRTLADVIIEVLSFQIETKSSQVQVKRLLYNILSFTPEEENVTPRSYYFFKKLVLSLSFKFVKIPLCGRCDSIVENFSQCDHCGFGDNFNKGEPLKFFLYRKFTPILQNIFSSKPHLVESMRAYYHECKQRSLRNFNVNFDFCTGSWYKLKDFSCWDMMIGLYTDGKCLYKTVSESLWPVFLCILNLPPSIRYKPENMVLIACSCRAPADFTAFLSPLVQEFISLHEGVPVENPKDNSHQLLKAYLVHSTMDIEAKTKFLHLGGSSSYYGCFYCKVRGEYLGHVYLNERPTSELMRNSSDLPEEVGSYAVSSLPSLFRLGEVDEFFDPIFSTVIDVMHNIPMGLQKNLDFMWFSSSSKFRNKGCFIRGKIAEIDSILNDLNKFLPPNISYDVKNLEKNGRWKSIQRETWFFYFGPAILKSHLPETFYSHWLLLVESIYTFCSHEIQPNDFECARRKLFSFLNQYSILYDATVMTSNAHQAYHIPECVERNGPLWVYACDYYETILGFYSRTVHATKLAIYSYCYSVLANELLHELKREFPKNSKNWLAINEKTSVLLDFTRGQKLKLANDESALKKLWIKIKERSFMIKPFSRNSSRDSSAISFLDHEGTIKCGRIEKILFQESNQPDGVSYSFSVQIRTYQQLPRTGFPSFYQIFSLNESSLSGIRISQILGPLMMFDSPKLKKVNNKHIVIAVDTLYRLS